MYESFFGLSAKPFQLNPDPDFFFGSRGHRRAMAYLEYGLHQGEGFIVITGEVGAGKTTLLRSLLRRIPQDTIEPAQIVSTQVDSNDLLRLAASAFGLPSEGLEKATLLTRLQHHFEALHHAGRRALLIVDEAQNLTPGAVEELRMLSNFQVGTKSLVQSFLVGQPEFRQIMQRPEMRQLKQRVIASYHLGPLGPEETRLYIEHRLRHVGWVDKPQFAAEAFEAIHTAAEGVPRRINTLCDRLMLAVYLSEQQSITAQQVTTVVEEMSEELGGVKTLPLVDALPVQGGRVAVAPRFAPQPDAEPNEIVARLEERVAALEASSTMTLGLLRRILRILRGNGNTSEGGEDSRRA